MEITSFADLLSAARQQPQPQRLLFVFVQASLPEDSTPEQRAAFEAGEGGTLTPVMCADKRPEELTDFDAFKAEAEQFGGAWSLVLASSMTGVDGVAPTSAEAEPALQDMVESFKSGALSNCIAFNAAGVPVNLV